MLKTNLVIVLFLLCTVFTYAHNGKVNFKFTENKGQFPSNVIFHNKLHVGDMFLEKDRFTFNMYDPKQLDDLYLKRHGGSSFSYKETKGRAKQASINDRALYSQVGNVQMNKHAYSMIFQGANANPTVSSEEQLQGYQNYFYGNDESKWASRCYSYRLVKYDELYDGIDAEVYSVFQNLKYDFKVAPNADVNQIRVNYDGVDGLKIDENGNLIIQLSHSEVKELRPIAYQDIDGKRVDVPVQFQLNGTELTFVFPEDYNHNAELTIDPTWVFSTLSGSTADNWGFTATYDSQGNLYAAGIAFAAGYPTTVGAQSTAFLGGAFDISIHKYNATGTTLLYGTYLGGSDLEMPHSMVCDANDELVLLASTGSSNFPTTAGAYDQTFNGGFANTPANMWGYNFASGTDIALVRLNNTGSVVNSTFIGGTDNEGLNESMVYNYSDQCRGEIVLDANGDVYVASSVFSSDFPVTDGSVINNGAGFGPQDAVVFKMSADLSALNWATFVGGTDFDTGYSIRVAPNGTVYITGGTTSTDIGNTGGALDPTFNGIWDGYIASFNGTTGAHIRKTYLGTNSYDQGFVLEVDKSGDVYVAGQTVGSYPVVSATYSDAFSGQFIHKMNGNLTATDYSTTVGTDRASAGSAVDVSLTAMLVDNCGNVYLSGWGGGFQNATSTGSYQPQAGNGGTTGLPVTGDAQQSTTDGSDFYFFVMERDATGQLYGTFLGDNGTSEHTDGGTSRFDPDGVVYQSVCAACNTGNFPTTPGVYSPTSGTAGQAFFCNMGAIKFEFDFQGVEAQATDPGDLTLCAQPYDVTFDAPTSNPPPSAEWFFGDGNGTGIISGSTSPTYTYADTGTYVVTYVAIDPASCNIRDTAVFDLTLIQPEQFAASIDVPPFDPCTSPTSLSIDLEFTGTGADSIIWDMGNGDVFTDSLDWTYTYTSQGNYTINMIAFDLVCNNIDTISQNVDFVYSTTLAQATPPGDITLCAAPYIVNFDGGATPPPNVEWNFGDGTGTGIGTDHNPTHTYADTGYYQVMYVAIDSSTCNIADTVYFDVNLIQPEQFSASIDVPPYDPCAGVAGVTLDLEFTGTGADSIIWDMGNGDVFIDSLDWNYTYTTPGTYTLNMIAFDLQCNNIDTISEVITFGGAATFADANPPGSITLCDPPFDVDFTINGAAPPNSFWDFGDGSGTSTVAQPTYTYADTGTYTVMYVAIDSNSCNIADTAFFDVTLIQSEELDAEITIPPFDPCTDTNGLAINLQFTGTGADSIFWDMGNGDTFIDSTDFVYTYNNQGNYVITMTAWDFQCNRTETVSANVDYVFSFSAANANPLGDILLCDPPYNVDFTVNGTPPPNSFWDFGDASGSSTDAQPTYTYADTGTYNVMYVAIDSSTCNIADTAYLDVRLIQSEQFSATLDFSPPPPCGQGVFQVDLAFTGTGADTLAWDMGDGTILFTDSISYVYTQPGTYTISLYAEDRLCNKVETISNTVTFTNNVVSFVEVPNVFSPNGDGFNDQIQFSGVDPNADYSWKIYNRWGKKIFESTDYTQAWDGTNMNNGRDLEAGVYYYELLYKDACETEERLVTGHITLMR